MHVHDNNSFPLHTSGAWGSYERRFSSHGLIVEHLRLLPPDSTARERLFWNLTAIWPTIGFFLGIATAVAVHEVASVDGSVAVGTAAWVIPWLWLAWRNRGFSRRVRDAWKIEGAGAWMVEPSPLGEHARRLSDASRWSGPHRGEHLRLTWLAVYSELDADARVKSVDRHTTVRAASHHRESALGPDRRVGER